MLHVIENTERRPTPGGPRKGTIAPYINASTTGKPVAIDDGDEKMWSVLTGYGTPVPIPDGLEVTVYASNAFLLSVLG